MAVGEDSVDTRQAFAMIVNVGLAPDGVGNGKAFVAWRTDRTVLIAAQRTGAAPRMPCR